MLAQMWIAGYLGGLPTRERPQHVHILETLDYWLFASYITAEKHDNLTKYVTRWSGDGLGGCRKVVPVPCALAGSGDAEDNPSAQAVEENEDGNETDPYGDIENESIENNEEEALCAAYHNYHNVVLPAVAGKAPAKENFAAQRSLALGRQPQQVVFPIEFSTAWRKRRRNSNTDW